ncbi:MAG: hypothetical protein ACREMK_10890 [Gemmatimonadota bacterium]
MNGRIRTPAMLGLALTLATACNRGSGTGAEPTVALVLKTLNNPFFIEMADGARAAADSLGIELLVQAPDREIDVEKQMQIVENLLHTRGADGPVAELPPPPAGDPLRRHSGAGRPPARASSGSGRRGPRHR